MQREAVNGKPFYEDEAIRIAAQSRLDKIQFMTTLRRRFNRDKVKPASIHNAYYYK